MAATQSNGLNRGITDTAASDGSAESTEIRRDIDRTRSEMDRTIDELGARLSPRSLFDDLVCSMRDSIFGGTALSRSGNTRSSAEMTDQLTAVTGRVGRSLAEAIRENPVPAALMGAGLAWLLFEDKAERQYRKMRHDYHQRGYSGDRWSDPGTHSGSYVDARTGEPYDESYGAGYEDRDFDGEPDSCPPSLKDKAAGAAHAIGSAAHGVTDAAKRSAEAAKNLASKTSYAASAAGRKMRSAGSRAGEYGRSAGDSMRRTGESLRDYRDRTRESARHYGNVMSDRLSHTYEMSCERYERALNEKPMAVGVAALAAGLLAGFALPSTRMEDEMYGRTSDRLKDEARRRALEAAEQGKEVAAHVAGSALSEAEGQGLTPGSLGDKFARVAKDAIHAAKESAQREGVDPSSLAQKAKFAGQAVRETGKEELRKVKDQGKEQLEHSTSSPSTATIGGLSDDMSAVKSDADRSHDIAEGMSESSEPNLGSSSSAKKSDESCEC